MCNLFFPVGLGLYFEVFSGARGRRLSANPEKSKNTLAEIPEIIRYTLAEIPEISKKHRGEIRKQIG